MTYLILIFFSESYIFDSSTNEWARKAEPESSYYTFTKASCGVVHREDGNVNSVKINLIDLNMEILDINVIIRGFFSIDAEYTLVYSVRDDAYTVGPDIKGNVSEPVAVPYGESFVLVGGFNYISWTESSSKL